MTWETTSTGAVGMVSDPPFEVTMVTDDEDGTDGAEKKDEAETDETADPDWVICGSLQAGAGV
jgi:hypothetical protein